MADLREALSRVEGGLEGLDRSVLLRELRPGLDRQVVRSQLKQAGLPSSPDVEVLYAWRDGTQTAGVTLDDIHVFPGFYLLSLDDAIANFRAFVADPRWAPGWLPLFANGGGDFYLVDLGGEPSGVMRHFRIDESEQPVEFWSLPDMMVTVAAGFDRGVFFVDPEGYLEMDDLVFAAVAAELNPRVPWWTD
ncbi:MAG: hypothetical protein ACK5MP_05635 [Nostocoides sp.]